MNLNRGDLVMVNAAEVLARCANPPLDHTAGPMSVTLTTMGARPSERYSFHLIEHGRASINFHPGDMFIVTSVSLETKTAIVTDVNMNFFQLHESFFGEDSILSVIWSNPGSKGLDPIQIDILKRLQDGVHAEKIQHKKIYAALKGMISLVNGVTAGSISTLVIAAAALGERAASPLLFLLFVTPLIRLIFWARFESSGGLYEKL